MIEEVEKRRSKNRNLIIIFFLFVLGLAITFEIRYFGLGKAPIGNSVAFLTIINLNLILLMVLALLVGRNLVKLYFERRRRLPGAKFRTKLVISFLALSLIPTILLFILASGLLTNILEKWLNLKIEETLTNSFEVAQFYYKDSKERTLHFSKEISDSIMEGGLLDKDKEEALLNLFEEKRAEYGLKMIKAFTTLKKEVASSRDPEIPKEIPLNILEGPLKGRGAIDIVSMTKGELILGASPIYSSRERKDIVGALVTATYIPQNLVGKMEAIHGAFEEYKQLQVFKVPIKITYLIVFLMATLLLIFSATWVGFYMSKGITIPIQNLIEATNSVSRGDLDSRIEIKAKDEMALLVNAFNKMTADLKSSKSGLEEANRILREKNIELEQRRRYIETVLSNVPAGVLSIDGFGRITAINRVAEDILGIENGSVIGKNYSDVFRQTEKEPFEEMIREMNETGVETLERQINVRIKDKDIVVLINLTILKDENDNQIGMVAVLDDLTHMVKVQRMMAWREVAQSIAHEVKNPLTPIQLSAQRLRKKYLDRLGSDGRAFDECTTTIIKQVEELKALVDEFSRFARMPRVDPTPNDLNEIVMRSIALYKNAHRDVSLNADIDRTLPLMEIDKGQIKRVLLNLIDNSITSMDGRGEITIRTHYDTARRIVTLEVIDTGCGIPDEDKVRLFEPYYSTKRSGTGLGLAIVNKIIADHNGSIMVKDNIPKGTRIIIELPVKGKPL